MKRSKRQQPGDLKTDWRYRLHEVMFEADTRAGKIFDFVLICLILLSIALVMLESIESYEKLWGVEFRAFEWAITLLFTIEYALRLACVKNRLRYAVSFFGIVDLLAILPSYIGLLITGDPHALMIVRSLRLLRVFRLLKLGQYVDETRSLVAALRATRDKIMVFLFIDFVLVMILGSLMYVVEGGQNGFTNIPTAVYWAVVTVTTVGYGDIVPHTPLGQLIAIVTMMLGYATIVVPTGVFSVEVLKTQQLTTQVCRNCQREGHAKDAVYCKYCGTQL